MIAFINHDQSFDFYKVFDAIFRTFNGRLFTDMTYRNIIIINDGRVNECYTEKK